MSTQTMAPINWRENYFEDLSHGWKLNTARAVLKGPDNKEYQIDKDWYTACPSTSAHDVIMQISREIMHQTSTVEGVKKSLSIIESLTKINTKMLNDFLSPYRDMKFAY